MAVIVRIAASVKVLLGAWKRLTARDRMTLRRELWAARAVRNKLIHLPVSWRETVWGKQSHTDTHSY